MPERNLDRPATAMWIPTADLRPQAGARFGSGHQVAELAGLRVIAVGISILKASGFDWARESPRLRENYGVAGGTRRPSARPSDERPSAIKRDQHDCATPAAVLPRNSGHGGAPVAR